MADKNIFKLEGKSQEQVKEAFLEFLKLLRRSERQACLRV